MEKPFLYRPTTIRFLSCTVLFLFLVNLYTAIQRFFRDAPPRAMIALHHDRPHHFGHAEQHMESWATSRHGKMQFRFRFRCEEEKAAEATEDLLSWDGDVLDQQIHDLNRQLNAVRGGITFHANPHFDLPVDTDFMVEHRRQRKHRRHRCRHR